MKAIVETSGLLRIEIWVFGSVACGLFARLMCDPMAEYFDYFDLSVIAVAAVGS